jgi:hypothetical protein
VLLLGHIISHLHYEKTVAETRTFFPLPQNKEIAVISYEKALQFAKSGSVNEAVISAMERELVTLDIASHKERSKNVLLNLAVALIKLGNQASNLHESLPYYKRYLVNNIEYLSNQHFF